MMTTAVRARVIDRQRFVRGIIVHEAIEPRSVRVNLLQHAQRAEVEHRRGRVTAVRREAAVRSVHDERAVRARCVGYVAELFAARAVNDLNVRAAGANTRPVAVSTER
jgi:hypothetical protein